MSEATVPLTVVVPARDAAATIAGTVSALVQQSLGAPRVVVVDDGSVDDTAAIALSLGGAVTVIPGRRLGPGAARNTGVEVVATPFLAFCDADDRWPTDRLECDLAVLSARPEIGVLLGRTAFEADDDALLAHIVFDGPGRTALIPSFGAATMRTSAFAAIGHIDESLRNYEDYEWFLRAREVPGRLVTHDRVAQVTWRHADSTSHRDPASPRDLLRLLQRSASRQQRSGRRLPSLSDLVIDLETEGERRA